MKLRKPSLLAAACGLLLAIASYAVAQGTGVVIISSPTVSASFNVEVPDDAESYQVTVYDHDGWWNPDDVLQSAELKDLKGPDGKKPKTININPALSCHNGEVVGSGGESTAEVYCVVTWYSKSKKEVEDAAKDDETEDIEPSGSTETEIQEVTCE